MPQYMVSISATELFGKMDESEIYLIDILRKLNKEFVITHATVLNNRINGYGNPGSVERNIRAAKDYIPENYKQQFIRFSNKYGGIGAVQLFYRGQLLELMRYASVYGSAGEYDPGQGMTEQQKKLFCQAALIAGRLWSARIYVSIDDIAKGNKTPLPAMMRKATEESGGIADLASAMGRGYVLFIEYMQKLDDRFGRAFAECSGMDLKEYFLAAASISTYTLPSSECFLFVKSRFSSPTRPELKIVLDRFIDTETQTASEIAEGFFNTYPSQGYKSLREKPIYANGPNLTVIDPELFYDKISIGPLFKVISHKDISKGIPANVAFSLFGKAFENYVCDLFKRLKSKQKNNSISLWINELGYYPHGKNYEIDVCIVRLIKGVKTAYIFEVKGVFLPSFDIMSDTNITHTQIIRSKYCLPDANGNLKGASQLANICDSVSSNCPGAPHFLADVKVVYPIIIAHDEHMDLPGVAPIINADFQKFRSIINPDVVIKDVTLTTARLLEKIEDRANLELLTRIIRSYNPKNDYVSLEDHVIRSNFSKLYNKSKFLTRVADSLIKECIDRGFRRD